MHKMPGVIHTRTRKCVYVYNDPELSTSVALLGLVPNELPLTWLAGRIIESGPLVFGLSLLHVERRCAMHMEAVPGARPAGRAWAGVQNAPYTKEFLLSLWSPSF